MDYLKKARIDFINALKALEETDPDYKYLAKEKIFEFIALQMDIAGWYDVTAEEIPDIARQLGFLVIGSMIYPKQDY